MFPNKIILSAISILVFFTACDNSDEEPVELNQQETEQAENINKLGTYKNARYNISLNYPVSWDMATFKDLPTGDFAVNIFKANIIPKEALPLEVHEKMAYSYVAVWPEGLATELPNALIMPFKDVMHAPALNFAINRVESKLLLLKDESIWGYFLVPKNPPEQWSDYGFIFAQVGVDGSITCFDEQTGEELPMKQCDHLEGDRVVRSGDIDEEAAETIRNILESISLEPIDRRKLK